jgi:hypothetical protein
MYILYFNTEHIGTNKVKVKKINNIKKELYFCLPGTGKFLKVDNFKEYNLCLFWKLKIIYKYI